MAICLKICKNWARSQKYIKTSETHFVNDHQEEIEGTSFLVPAVNLKLDISGWNDCQKTNFKSQHLQ